VRGGHPGTCKALVAALNRLGSNDEAGLCSAGLRASASRKGAGEVSAVPLGGGVGCLSLPLDLAGLDRAA
jgi:hypothetical protein